MTFNFSADVLKLNPGLKAVPIPATPSKYKNARTESRGMTFQSGREAAAVSGLILAEEAKQIFSLRLQVRFPLAGGTVYVADAVYLDEKLVPHIVDAKGFRDKVYRLKCRLFKAKYGVEIEER